MNERCGVCDLKFEREQGYFLGAMYISYGLALATIAIISAVLWAVTGWWMTKTTVWAVFLFLPLAPTITLFSRVLWLYVDHAFDPEPVR
jgi:ABC-type multidrug transport system permease subunit